MMYRFVIIVILIDSRRQYLCMSKYNDGHQAWITFAWLILIKK